MKTSDDLITLLRKAGNILDNAPIPHGLRYVWAPVNEEMVQVFVSKEDIKRPINHEELNV